MSGLEQQLVAALVEKISLLNRLLKNDENDEHPSRGQWLAQREQARQDLARLRARHE